MKLPVTVSAIALMLACTVAPRSAMAVFPAITFTEVVQTADLIFSGTVISIDYKTSGSAVYTEATFDDVEVQHATSRSLQKDRQNIVLRYAGGQVKNDSYLDFSDSPRFVTGHTYMVFALDNGDNYLTPIVGGPQGLFEIVKDPVTNQPAVTTSGGKAVTGIDESGRPALTATPVNGRNVRIPAELATVEPPVTPDGRRAEPSRNLRETQTSPPLSIKQFRNVIKENLKKPLLERRLRGGGPDNLPFHRLGDVSVLPNSLRNEAAESSSQETRGQTLSVCGTHLLPIVMKQRPVSEGAHGIIAGCLNNFNDYMDIFQTIAGTGTYDGGNGINEFGGIASSSELSAEYIAFNWGASLGVCWTYRGTGSGSCPRIIESDVFWSPHYTFSTDPAVWFKNTSNTYNLRAVLIHEIGHVWGYQTGGEAYDYDDPSIMHAIYNNVYETGEGLHARDAQIIRSAYQGQTPVKNFTDVGVESYYASNGLNLSTATPGTLNWGDPIAFNDVTVENMSNTTVNNVRIRFFLSDEMGFGGNFYQVWQEWVFPSMSPTSKSRYNYTNALIPRGTPTGSYFVLAKVDRGDGVEDSLAANDFTVFTGKVYINAPTISVAPAALSQVTSAGTNAAAQQFTATVHGPVSAGYYISIDYTSGTPGWLSVSPTYSEALTVIDVAYNSASLPPGTYKAVINVSGEAGIEQKVVPVTLTVSPGAGVDKWSSY